MEIKVTGTPEEIGKLLDIISGNEEQLFKVESDIATLRADLANS